MKDKQKREPALKIPMPFDQAIKRALKVSPPPEGWAAFERAAKKKRAKRAKKRKSAA